MNSEELRSAWERFAANNDFMLNPDSDHVSMVIAGVLGNEQECGLKLCPCRLRDGTRRGDLALICPCNFQVQDCWQNEGRCWCGLFVKPAENGRK